MRLQYAKDLVQVREAFENFVELAVIAYNVTNPRAVVEMKFQKWTDLPRYARLGWHTAVFIPAVSPSLALPRARAY